MDQKKFDQQFRLSRIMATAFLVGLFLAGGLFWFLKNGAHAIKPGIQLNSFNWTLLLSGMMIFGLIPFFRWQTLVCPGRGQNSPSEEDFLGALNVSSVVSLVLLSTACYFYLIYFFIRGEVLYLYAALIVGGLGFGLYFPRRDRWKWYMASHAVNINH